MKDFLLHILFFLCLTNIVSAQINDSLPLPAEALILDTLAVDSISNINVIDEEKNTNSIVDQFIKEDSVSEIIRDIEIEFIKPKIEQSSDSIYFNVCKITNTTNRDLSGKIRINTPKGWHLIANPSMEIILHANESISLPVRVSIPREAVGGMAYVIDASFESLEGYYSGAAYIKIPLKVKWDMYLANSTLYFNEYFETVLFDIHINNKGNAPELINLQFKVGHLLDILEVNEAKKDFFVKVPPQTDTVFTYTILRSQITEDKRKYYSRIWDESTIKVKALSGSDNKVKTDMLWVRDLDNQYIHDRQERSSPLNIQANVYNLLSANHPKLNLRAFGQILFKKQHDLSYSFKSRNLFYSQNIEEGHFKNPNNYTFRIQYKWRDKIAAELGQVYNNTMHSVRGWGIKAQYNFNKTDELSASYIIGRFYPSTSYSLKYKRKIKSVRAWAGITHQNNQYVHYKALSPEIGAAFSLSKIHTFRIGLMGTNAIFDNNQGIGTPKDSTLQGFSYIASYSGAWKKFRIGGNTRNDQFNFIRVRPSNKIHGYMRYIINPKSRINLIGNYNSVSTSGYIYSPFYNGSYNKQSIYRLTYLNRIKKNVILEAGPMARILNRLLIQNDTSTSNFTNYFGGLFVLSRIKFDEFQMLTPSLSMGYTYFKDQLNPNKIIRELPAINLGLSYINRNLGASANYIYGPNFFVRESFFQSNKPVNYETVQARMYHTKHFYEKHISISNYFTYFLRLPTNRQNFVLSSMLNFNLPNGWTANIRANLYTNSVDEDTQGIITHRNFSMNIGIKKSFDIPQPRIKYYDVNIICFNDMNGDGIRGDEEPLLSNIKLKLSKRKTNRKKTIIRFGEQELVTNTNGEIILTDIPQGAYIAQFEPLFNLGNLYNAKGDEQEIEIIQNMDYYIPYVESYQVNGVVSLIRDEFSDKGLVNVNGVRVEAVNEKGETFAALTDPSGHYVINVPQAGYFTVKVNNVFGEGFEIDKDKFLIQFDGFKQYTVDFTFYEGKKEINFGNGEQFFNFKSLTQQKSTDSTNKSQNISDSLQKPTEDNKNPVVEIPTEVMQPKKELENDIRAITPQDSTIIQDSLVKYMVEIGMATIYIKEEYTDQLAQLNIKPTPIKVKGITIYASSVLNNIAEAENLIQKMVNLGFTEGVIVKSIKGKIYFNN